MARQQREAEDARRQQLDERRADLMMRQQRKREEAQLQQRIRENLERARRQEQEARAVRERIDAYMRQQRAWGIPDVLYVKLDDNVELIVYRNPGAPDEFWAVKGDATRGVGKLKLVDSMRGPAGGFVFEWKRTDERNANIDRLIRARATFPVSDQPAPPAPRAPQVPTMLTAPAMPTAPTVPAPKASVPKEPVSQPPMIRPVQEVAALPMPSPPAPPSPRRPPPVRRDAAGIQLRVPREMRELAEQEPALTEREKELARELQTPGRMLEAEEEDIRSEAELSTIMLRAVREKRLRLQEKLREQAREKLERESKQFRSKRARELQAEQQRELEAVAKLETREQEKLKRLKGEIRAAAPERRLARAEQALEKIRPIRALSELKKRQLDAIEELQAVLNRRLFQGDARRPRTLDELFARLPDRRFQDFSPTLREFAKKWKLPTKDGRPLDPEEDVMSVPDQTRLVSAYLCGFNDAIGDHTPGYFEKVLGLERGECQILL